MEFGIVKKAPKKNRLFIITSNTSLKQVSELADAERKYVSKAIGSDQQLVAINKYGYFLYFSVLKLKTTDWQTTEAMRKAGAEIAAAVNKQKIDELTIINLSGNANAAYGIAEGMALASYQFLKYRSDAQKKTYALKQINFTADTITVKEVNQLNVIMQAVYHARTLVNEPLSHLSATQLSKEIAMLGKQAGFNVTILGKEKIVKEKMGGLLAVNAGSIEPPTFTIMEYKPKKAINKSPIVLVGKGVVFDTGGLSLKPTPNSMDRMKTDMSGAALVSAAMYAITKMKLPLHVIALVPATDNRPGENAYVPGDVIRMYSGATVEVLNTDAEGRLILADALHWAKRYKPELVVDFATLTGAASVAVGEHGIVCMGTVDEQTKQAFRDSGFRQYERLVEYPLWEEYGDMIKSDIADLKNVGGSSGGAITAGKFLEYFTEYPWMHFDIAGVSFANSKKGYTPMGGTGYGLRMLLDFLLHYGKA
jgi:leucyl aminopeptidase